MVLTTTVANWFRKKVGIAMGLMGAGIGGGGLMVILITQMIQRYQWRTALVILALGMAAVCLPLCGLVRNRPEEYGEVPDGNSASSFELGPEDPEKRPLYREPQDW